MGDLDRRLAGLRGEEAAATSQTAPARAEPTPENNAIAEEPDRLPPMQARLDALRASPRGEKH